MITLLNLNQKKITEWQFLTKTGTHNNIKWQLHSMTKIDRNGKILYNYWFKLIFIHKNKPIIYNQSWITKENDIESVARFLINNIGNPNLELIRN